jgi:hypothetical protein
VWEPLIWSSSVRRLESWADGGLEVAQQRVWRRLVIPGSHNTGDGATVLGWWCSGGDGRKGSELAEETRSTSPMSWRRLVRARVGVCPLFEGSVVLFRGVRHADRTGVGITVSRS